MTTHRPTDKELNARLAEVYGYTPSDGFAWIRFNLRRGRVHCIVRHDPRRSHYKDRVYMTEVETKLP